MVALWTFYFLPHNPVLIFSVGIAVGALVASAVATVIGLSLAGRKVGSLFSSVR